MTTNRVAIITGASRGIGKACAEAFFKEGYKLVLFARNAALLASVVAVLEDKGAQVLSINGDVRNPEDVRHAVEDAKKRFGRIDVLVNNAGVAYGPIPLTDFPEEQWHETIDTNLTALYYWIKAVLPLMKEQGSGIIINVSSMAGKQGFGGFAAYCASKFGVIGLTESVAEEVKGYGIKVVALCPGGVHTDMHMALFPQHRPEDLLKPEEVSAKIISLSDPRDRTPSGSSVDIYKKY
ncbi:MAG: SDR family oxidoreductase [Candidatus Brocadiales bacterium]|nr:SDR family oxidoreductase [Candidatus Brocadiales bacterium]